MPQLREEWSVIEQHQPSTIIQACLDRLRDGDEAARTEVLSAVSGRFLKLTRKMLKDEPRVGRWEEAEDVCQNALLRLHRSLADVQPATVRDFFRLAATQIRRELIDLARHYYGPEGQGAHHASQTGASSDTPPCQNQPGELSLEPSRLAMWTEFHRQIDSLPEEEKEVFDLLWYQGLKQAEAAQILGASERTLQRRWHAACEHLQQVLKGSSPV